MEYNFKSGEKVYLVCDGVYQSFKIAVIENIYLNGNFRIGLNQYRQDGSRAGDCHDNNTRVVKATKENYERYGLPIKRNKYRQAIVQYIHETKDTATLEQAYSLLKAQIEKEKAAKK